MCFMDVSAISVLVSCGVWPRKTNTLGGVGLICASWTYQLLVC